MYEIHSLDRLLESLQERPGALVARWPTDGEKADRDAWISVSLFSAEASGAVPGPHTPLLIDVGSEDGHVATLASQRDGKLRQVARPAIARRERGDHVQHAHACSRRQGPRQRAEALSLLASRV